jgi:hypothetical protein
LTSIDGRCRVARMIREFAKELERHVGGNPTPAQQTLIREAAIKNVRCAFMIDKILDQDDLDFDLATRTYLAWSNSLRRDLEALGIKAPEQKAPQLADFLPVKKGRAAALSRAHHLPALPSDGPRRPDGAAVLELR